MEQKYRVFHNAVPKRNKKYIFNFKYKTQPILLRKIYNLIVN